MYQFNYARTEDEDRWEGFSHAMTEMFGDDLSLNAPGRHSYRYAVKFSEHMGCKTMTVLSQDASLEFDDHKVVSRKPRNQGEVVVHFLTPNGRQSTQSVTLEGFASDSDSFTVTYFRLTEDRGMTPDEAMAHMKSQADEKFDAWYADRKTELEGELEDYSGCHRDN